MTKAQYRYLRRIGMGSLPYSCRGQAAMRLELAAAIRRGDHVSPVWFPAARAVPMHVGIARELLEIAGRLP